MGAWDSPGYAEGVAVAGSTAYLADGPYGLWDAEVLRDAILHLADSTLRQRLARKLLMWLPEYVSAGRYLEAWMLQKKMADPKTRTRFDAHLDPNTIFGAQARAEYWEMPHSAFISWGGTTPSASFCPRRR